MMIPEDYSKEDLLKNFRRVFDEQSTQRIEKATCHDEPHRRFRPSADRRERHKHIALKASGPFAHKKIAEAFYQKYGMRISFSFKLNRFVGYLKYLTEPGKKTSTDLDTQPAKYPPNLDLHAALKAAEHPQQQQDKSSSRKRKRLSFDEVSNVILEGVGAGPIRTAAALEAAARSLKQEGKVELWNCLGELKSRIEVNELVARVWRLNGNLIHPLWHPDAPYAIEEFDYQTLDCVAEWIGGKYKTHALVLSGDGGLGKTSLAEALIKQVSAGGYWFLDDPDDFREIDGFLQADHGLVIDEVELSSIHPNQIKKLFDLEKGRRVKCRHFNGTIPPGCARIFITNSDEKAFYPKMSAYDQTGVMRRQLFQAVKCDLRIRAQLTELESGRAVPAVGLASDDSATHKQKPTDVPWRDVLQEACQKAHVAHLFPSLSSVCDELGVAERAELFEFAAEIVSKVPTKPLERRRLLACLHE
jgi:hypothetical protein